MGKRQIILFPARFDQLERYMHLPVDIVLHSGLTHKGKITKIQNEVIFLEKPNSRLEFIYPKKIALPFQDIYQIIIAL
jgi:sRNA-binding regulator protein Hfq